MPFNVDKYLDAVFAANPALRNEDAQVASLVRAAELADIPAPARPPRVQVQRVDTKNLRTGEVTTEWEVVDTRLPKRDRIVKRGLATEQLARTEAGKRTIAGGAYTLTAVDSDEYFHDTDYELLGNAGTYGVYAGCALTYDAADMTVDLAAGAVKHNAGYVAVAVGANAYTLVADGSNERWAALCISSAGAAALVSGDAAASASVEPSKPEIGDRVLLGMAKIQAAQTIADNCEYKLDKRLMLSDLIRRTTSNFTKNANTTLADVTGLGFFVGASEVWGFEVIAEASLPATPAIKVAFTVPSGTTITGVVRALAAADDTGVYAVRSADLTTAVTGLTFASVGVGLRIFGTAVASSTAGIVQLQAAQNTSNASDSILYANSSIRAWRIA